MRLALVVFASLVICTIGWAQEEYSLAEKLTALESPRWRDREMTLKRFEFLMPRFAELCSLAEVRAADGLYVARTATQEAGVKEGLLEFFNNAYISTLNTLSTDIAFVDGEPPECARIWAVYAMHRMNGMTPEEVNEDIAVLVMLSYVFDGE